MRVIRTVLLPICFAGMVLGCDPVTTHKITSTIFDGVPSLPPAEQYCQDYHEQKLVEEEAMREAIRKGAVVANISKHLPYAEKRCNDCHDKSKEFGLIRPPKQLCFVCHPTIIDGANVHGPAASGDCLECHEPHSASQPALLKMDKTKLCIYCHKEKRIAEAMHQRVNEKGILCMDCHDPHAGNNSYFLK